MSPAQLVAGQTERRVERDGLVFTWQHKDHRLFGDLSAPTNGWLAVGFNDEPTLKKTRFLIGVVEGKAVRAAWHIAAPPHHQPIESLGGTSDIQDLDGHQNGGRSRIIFSLPHQSADRFAIDLAPGHWIHLMLAWSHEPDFAHHSAWRRHIDVTL